MAAPEIQKPTTTESTRHHERYVAPPVDIYETQEGLDVRVDNHVLTIRGHAHHAVPGDAIYREHELINFFRQFELSDTVDPSRITADLKWGVLTVQLPKAEQAKPRQIEVRVG